MFTPRKRNAAVAVLATVSLSAGLGIFSTGASAAVQDGVAITGLSVVKGSTTATTSTLITGTGFSKLTSAGVKFGTKTAANVIVLSDTQIAAVAPPADNGKVDVTLTDTEPVEGGDPVVTDYPALTGTAAVTVKDDFTYLTPFPATVTAGTLLSSVGGGKLTVTSTADMGADAAAFTANKVTATIGNQAAAVTRVDNNTVTLAVPAGVASSTAAKVVLLHDGVPGAASTAAKYAAVITATDVPGGALKGGEKVVITGKGLKGATAWKFGGVAAADGACSNAAAPADDTKVTCTVPAASGYSATPADSTAVAGPVSITFTPAAGAPYGVTAKATWTYSDLV